MKAALRRTGWQPYSVKVGDTYYAFNRLDPLGMTTGLAADIAEVVGQLDEPDAGEIAAAGVLAIMSNLVSKTYLSGIAAVTEFLSGGPAGLTVSSAEQYIGRTLASFVPFSGALGTIERTIDPTMREAANVVDAIRARVPGFSDDLPPRRNLWGEPIVLQGGLGPDIASPIYTSTETSSAVDAEIVANRVPIQMPSRVIGDVELTPQEYDRLVVLAGEPAKAALETVIKSDAYQHATTGPEGGRATVIRNVVNQFREAARAQVVLEFPELRATVHARATDKARALIPQ
jgi:hypothetical protein